MMDCYLQKGKCKILHLGRKTTRYQHIEKQDDIKGPEGPGKCQLLYEPEMCLCGKKRANSVPHCIRQSMASRSKIDDSPLLSTDEATTGSLCPALAPHCKGDTDIQDGSCEGSQR